MHNTPINRKLFTSKHQNLQKFMIDIFNCWKKVKIGGSLEVTNDIFKFIEGLYFLRINLQFKAEVPYVKT